MPRYSKVDSEVQELTPQAIAVGTDLGVDDEIPVSHGVLVHDDGHPHLEQEPSSGPVMVVAAEAATTVEVLAPSNLREGYQFRVDLDGAGPLLVEVPKGGVQAGQRFHARVISEAPVDEHNIPRGRWRDNLFDCLIQGLCHPQCCLTTWLLWTRLCALGQIQARFRLDPCGQPTLPRLADQQYGNRMNVIVWSCVIASLFFGGPVTIGASVFLVVATMNTRNYIRRKYSIPEQNCGGCEDCCCAFWCNPCVICQMARHTADYNKFEATCCSDTGLLPGTPSIVDVVEEQPPAARSVVEVV